MQANLPGLTESVACTTIQLRVAKEIIDKQWNVIQEDRARLEEELERFAREKENYEQERRNFETERTWVAQNMVEDKVCLCVGGKYMATSRNTLMAKEGSMLSAMFSGRHKLALSLDYLRTDKLYLPNPDTQPELYSAVLDEFDYFCVPLPQPEPEILSTSLLWERISTSEVLIEDSPCSTECIKVAGDVLLCGRYDGFLDAWSLASKKLLKRVKTEHETIFSIEALGNTIYTVGSGSSHIYVWDFNLSSVTSKLTGHLQDVRTLRLWNDVLVSGSNDHTVKVWDIQQGKCVATLEGHDGDVTCVDFDGELIVSGSEDCCVRVWSCEKKICRTVFSGHADRISCVALHKGQFVVSGSPDGMLKLWNLETGTCDRTFHIGFAACVWSLAISGDCVVCGCDENIKIWDLSTGTPLNTLGGHQDHVWGVQVVDNLLVSCSEDCTVRLWRENDPGPGKTKKCKSSKKKHVSSDEESLDDLLPLTPLTN